MMRGLTAGILLVVLLAGAAGSLHMHESVEREDPLGKKLLYLPTAPFLDILSLGNRTVMADLLFLWSIQYYAQFEPNTQFEYLGQVFDLITDLDPHYVDAYRVGAIIMLIEAEGTPENRKKAVLSLLDKGIRNSPKSYVLANEAAWHCFITFNDPQTALKYAKIAAEHPDASHFYKRFYGHLASRQDSFSTEDAIAYWQDVLGSATTAYQKNASMNALYDLQAKRDKRFLEKLLNAYMEKHGHCPENWQALISEGFIVEGKTLSEVPLDFAGNPYQIDQSTCTVVAHKRLESVE